ncbi:uncharacterized protein K452DRAFT_120011 [Aplosporella prunicola CBS 121167]|uniref:Uncharacterized protein n=1 Tax=Aplosporella prunicola CBS 121167 TaxID=1176127 RepID=A0A6A6BMU2_9PEZI|nr:uncharacterized protein K452DRAFT_120011 [Aplosporella prunicola CBS 121167]KAF2145452.1 hypothetical protein K452DRAFT_120011 [Aplosporella prunicola CBS 121167]
MIARLFSHRGICLENRSQNALFLRSKARASTFPVGTSMVLCISLMAVFFQTSHKIIGNRLVRASPIKTTSTPSPTSSVGDALTSNTTLASTRAAPSPALPAPSTAPMAALSAVLLFRPFSLYVRRWTWGLPQKAQLDRWAAVHLTRPRA